MPEVNSSLCVACSSCVDICPVDAIDFVDNKAKINQDICVECDACIDECPRSAIN